MGVHQLGSTSVKESQLPIVFVEGDYDIRYLTKAFVHFGQTEFLTKFRFADGEGFGNLDKIWNSMSSRVAEVLTARTLLLYDCDTRKSNRERSLIHARVIPSESVNPIKDGIENLFSSVTVAKLEAASKKFIDFTPERTDRVRGVEAMLPERRSVNRDEKRNICDWLCEHGTSEDFIGFRGVVNLIIDFVNTEASS